MIQHYCTYFDKNYLVKGLALIESLNRHATVEIEIYVICLDEITRIIIEKLDLPCVRTIALHQIEQRDAELLAAKNNRTNVEYYWTLTPTVLWRILQWYPHIKQLTYLDADLFFFSSPDPIWEEFDNRSVMIHEHRFPSDQLFLEKFGKFNVDLLTFQNDTVGMDILNRWRQQCLEWCYARLEDGRYGDQLYLNEWPLISERVGILKHIGAGVAPWNHIQYTYERDNRGGLRVNGWPLIFYHFHSLAFVEPKIIIPSKFITNPLTKDILRFCFLPYIEALQAAWGRAQSIQPDFSCGLRTNGLLGEQHTFIAHVHHRDRILDSNISQRRFSLSETWDLYASPQMIAAAPSVNTDRRIEKFGATEIEALNDPTQSANEPADLSGSMPAGVENIRHSLFDAYSADANNKAALQRLCRHLIHGKEWRAAEMIMVDFIKRRGPDSAVLQMLKRLEKPLLLNLDCGTRYHPDWVNLNFTASGPEVIAHNLYHGIPFADGTFEVVYHSHVLEHFPKEFGGFFIKECKRVLKPGGILRVVVPDLEQMVREYLAALDGALQGENEARRRYDWMLIEMLDQLVRNRSGGEMLEYWKQNPMPAENYVFQRLGSEVKSMVQQLRQNPSPVSRIEDPYLNAARSKSNDALNQLAGFRVSGEVHQWMYDRYSLTRLLIENGFADICVCRADESAIPEFNRYKLDIETDGSVRKPDSLFIEAVCRVASALKSEPKSDTFSLEKYCIETISKQNGLFDRLPVLKSQRDALALNYLNTAPERLQTVYTMETRDLHIKLVSKGLMYYAGDESENPVLKLLAHELKSGRNSKRWLNCMLAATLYYYPHQMPNDIDLAQIPEWLLRDYMLYLLIRPIMFSQPGEVDYYSSYMSELMKKLWLLTHKSGNLSQIQAEAARLFLEKVLMIPLYFSRQELKHPFRQRCELLKRILPLNGCTLDHLALPCKNPQSKIRIGVFLRYICETTETFATLPVFAFLDRNVFEVYLYTEKSDHNPVERYARERVDHFVVLSDDHRHSVNKIRKDNLDILFFGNNMTACTNFSAVLASHRLARTQWVHFYQPVSTGMPFVDFFVLGATVASEPGMQDRFNEKIVTIEGSGICFDIQETITRPLVADSHKFKDGDSDSVVFVSGANFYKIIPELLQVWSKILKAVPRAQLWLYPFGPAWSESYPTEVCTNHLSTFFERDGLDPQRLKVLNRLPGRAEILEMLSHCHVYLDAIPYSGATSLLDPLQAGVPPIVMRLDRLRFCQGAAMLEEMGLSDMVVRSESDYIRQAVLLAHNPALRLRMKDQILRKMMAVPDFLNPAAYGAKIGSIFAQYCANQKLSGGGPTLFPINKRSTAA